MNSAVQQLFSGTHLATIDAIEACQVQKVAQLVHNRWDMVTPSISSRNLMSFQYCEVNWNACRVIFNDEPIEVLCTSSCWARTWSIDEIVAPNIETSHDITAAVPL